MPNQEKESNERKKVNLWTRHVGRTYSPTLTAAPSSLSAGLLRQATYTTTRLGVYNAPFEHFR